MVEVYDRIYGVGRRAGEIARVGTDLAIKGVGVAGGMISGKYVGDLVEDMVMDMTSVPAWTLTDKMLGWLCNNAPKGVLSYLVSQYKTGEEMMDNVLEGVSYGLAASVVVDTYERSLNDGKPGLLKLSQSGNVQQLLRENSNLKQSIQRLTSDIQRLSHNAPIVRVEPVESRPMLTQPNVVRVETQPTPVRVETQPIPVTPVTPQIEQFKRQQYMEESPMAQAQRKKQYMEEPPMAQAQAQRKKQYMFTGSQPSRTGRPFI